MILWHSSQVSCVSQNKLKVETVIGRWNIYWTCMLHKNSAGCPGRTLAEQEAVSHWCSPRLKQEVHINVMERRDIKITSIYVSSLTSVSQTLLNNHSLNICSQFTFIFPVMDTLFLVGFSGPGSHILPHSIQPEEFSFSFFKYILLIMLLQLSHFAPFIPLHPALPQPQSPPFLVHVHGSYI